jgi:sulfoxide reductase heme-binding subunit YedZ
MSQDPNTQVFWFASRALGIVAIGLLGMSVAIGLTLSGKLARRYPGLPAKLTRLHQASTLVALALIAGHGGLLLLDSYLRPGLAGITLPFALSYRPAFTGIGIIAGWLSLILALSFYVRRWIGTKTWRWLHRFTIVAYLFALGHAIGAGTDATSWWMLGLLTLINAPIVFAFTYRVLPAHGRAPALRAGAPAGINRPGPAGPSRLTSAELHG